MPQVKTWLPALKTSKRTANPTHMTGSVLRVAGGGYALWLRVNVFLMVSVYMLFTVRQRQTSESVLPTFIKPQILILLSLFFSCNSSLVSSCDRFIALRQTASLCLRKPKELLVELTIGCCFPVDSSRRVGYCECFVTQ